MTADFGLFIRIGAALAIGFMIGLQREFAHQGEGSMAGTVIDPGHRNWGRILDVKDLL